MIHITLLHYTHTHLTHLWAVRDYDRAVRVMLGVVRSLWLEQQLPLRPRRKVSLLLQQDLGEGRRLRHYEHAIQAWITCVLAGP